MRSSLGEDPRNGSSLTARIPTRRPATRARGRRRPRESFLVEQQAPTSRALAALSRVVALAPRVAHLARVLALVSASAVVAVWVVSALVARPDASTEWLSRVFLLAAALAPALVLVFFASGIDDLRELPQRYRRVGADVRSRVDDLRAHGDRGRGGIFGPLIGLVRAAFGARDLLSPLTVATTALRPILLVGVLVAAVIALLEVPVAGAILVVVLQ